MKIKNLEEFYQSLGAVDQIKINGSVVDSFEKNEDCDTIEFRMGEDDMNIPFDAILDAEIGFNSINGSFTGDDFIGNGGDEINFDIRLYNLVPVTVSSVLADL